MRRDALFQTVTIGGRALANTDTAQLCALRTEVAAWSALMTAVREPIAVYCTPSAGGMHNLRLALRQRYPGEVRNAIAAVFASNADVKNVFVVDEDIDIFSDAASITTCTSRISTCAVEQMMRARPCFAFSSLIKPRLTASA
jgi:UbiD family decarboxylase